ncbi:ATP-binding protein [Nocardia goodfellowii]|uniref:Signal transduction histidine kinase n=1 Tax=Nocardia goodfellowii TaxID=882446 RepID=A0ABS4QI11_9NOCA|nr:ATP-binding protein [Nocardia goodfellowii]MBP2190301.1 signal transduction histidine kinase [Nocardia goodfellowii]
MAPGSRASSQGMTLSARQRASNRHRPFGRSAGAERRRGEDPRTNSPAGTPPTADQARAGRWRRAFATETSSEPAADRILRRLALVFGIAGVLAVLAETPEIAEQSRAAAPAWTVLTVVLAFGWFPVLAIVSFGSSTRVIQWVSGAAAICYLLAFAVVPLAYRESHVDATAVWLYRLFALGVLAAALAWRPMIAVGYLVVGAAASAAANMYVTPYGTGWGLAGDFVRAAGLCVLFLWCAIYARAAAARVDRESAIASSRAAVAAGAAARDRERARFAALIHDAVLSTLLDASRAGVESPVLRSQAERTLVQLDEARGSATEPDRLDAKHAIDFLRAAVHDVNPGIAFAERRWSGFDDLRLPVQAAGAIAAALVEAVRNSLRHATVPGRAVQRTVTVTVSAGGIRVVFRDDGAGFDLSRVPADRLGVSVSILGRMRQLAGGAGFVESAPGEGTTVTLVWGSDG